MKKFLLYFAIIAICFATTSCNKEEDNQEPNNPLVGTKWYMDHPATYVYGQLNGGTTWNLVMEFTSNTTYDAYFFCLNNGLTDHEEKDRKYEYYDWGIKLISEDGTETPYYFHSPSQLCTKKQGETGVSYSFYKNKPQW